MKILRVGDMHVQPKNMNEAEKIMQFVPQTASKYSVDRIEFLGDLNHFHGIIRLEVQEFWNYWLAELSSRYMVKVLVGNHDRLSNKDNVFNSLNVFKKIGTDGSLKIFSQPAQEGIYLFVPYIHDNQEFINVVKSFPTAKVLVCHAEFDGSRYENGFYAPNGVKPEEIPIDIIISGHIHSSQIIANGKVDYPGTPTWNTNSDANEKKGIWLYEHDDISGKVLSRSLIPTDKIVTPIVGISWNEGDTEPELPRNAKVLLELIGSSDWITKQKVKFKDIASIKSTITDRKKIQNRKSGNGFSDFLLNICDTNMDREKLFKYAKELGIV